MCNSPTSPKVNRATIAGRAILEVAANLKCPSCGTNVRGIDAELLEPGLRIICRHCHALFLDFDPVR